MIVKVINSGRSGVAYRDDSPNGMGDYFSLENEVAVSVDYPVKFAKYGVHPRSRAAVLKRLDAKVPDGYRWNRISWGGPGSQEVVAIYRRSQ